jgi:hypothetical protein
MRDTWTCLASLMSARQDAPPPAPIPAGPSTLFSRAADAGNRALTVPLQASGLLQRPLIEVVRIP